MLKIRRKVTNSEVCVLCHFTRVEAEKPETSEVPDSIVPSAADATSSAVPVTADEPTVEVAKNETDESELKTAAIEPDSVMPSAAVTEAKTQAQC